MLRPPQKMEITIYDFPIEVIMMIIGCNDVGSIIRLRAVSSTFRDIIDSYYQFNSQILLQMIGVAYQNKKAGQFKQYCDYITKIRIKDAADNSVSTYTRATLSSGLQIMSHRNNKPMIQHNALNNHENKLNLANELLHMFNILLDAELRYGYAPTLPSPGIFNLLEKDMGLIECTGILPAILVNVLLHFYWEYLTSTNQVSKETHPLTLFLFEHNRDISCSGLLMSVQEAADKYKQHPGILRGLKPLKSLAYLNDTDINNAQKRQIIDSLNGRYLNLEKTNLTGIDLSGLDLRNLHLKKCNLSNANLINTNMSELDLSRCQLNGADLRHANLSGTKINPSLLSGAKLAYTNFSGCIVFPGTDFLNPDVEYDYWFYLNANLNDIEWFNMQDTESIKIILDGFGLFSTLSSTFKRDVIPKILPSLVGNILKIVDQHINENNKGEGLSLINAAMQSKLFNPGTTATLTLSIVGLFSKRVPPKLYYQEIFAKKKAEIMFQLSKDQASPTGQHHRKNLV